MQPTAAGERHGFVDALRGFALLGILVVNIEFIVQPSELGWKSYEGGFDEVVRWLVVALGQTKVYPLFALLFGYGLALQLRKADAAGSDLWPRYRRRRETRRSGPDRGCARRMRPARAGRAP